MADYRKVNHQFIIECYLEDKTNNVEYNINDKITQIAVKKNYVENIFPLFVLTLNVENELRNIIKNNKVGIYLSISQFSINEDEDQDNISPVIENNVVSTSLRIFDHNLTELDEYSSSEDDEEDPIKNKLQMIQLSCIPEDLIENNDEVLNDVLLNASIDDALVEILGDCKNVYIDPSDNTEIYETLLIPPLNRSKAIEWLKTNYGIYNTGYSLFFDTDTTYLSKLKNNSEDSYINSYDIEIVKSNEMSSANINVLEIDEDNNIRKFLNTIPEIIRITDVRSDVLGGTAIVGSYGSEFELSSNTYKLSDNKKVRYYWNNNGDNIFANALFTIPEYTMNLILSDINPNLVSLKTKVNLHSYDQAYNGVYAITSASTIFTSVNKKTFKCTTLITCTK